MSASCTLTSLLILLAFALGATRPYQVATAAQQPRPFCDQQYALSLIRQQAAQAKGLDDPADQVSLMISAGDSLWPYEQAEARALFGAAYDLAQRRFEKKSDEPRPEAKGPRAQTLDLRPAVIQAIARRDPEWARRLTGELTGDARAEAGEGNSPDGAGPHAGEKLLGVAVSLLPATPVAAVSFARQSLRHPASYALGRFIFRLAESNQTAADHFYREALSAYAHAPIAEFLYLSAYPFAAKRIAGPEALSTYFVVPQGMAPNLELQRLYLELLLRRSARSLEAASRPVSGPYRLQEPAQIYLALSNLEPLVAQYQPAQLERVAEAKWRVSSEVYADTARELTDIARRQRQLETPPDSFASLAERAERESSDARRDRLIVQAVLASAEAEGVDGPERLIQKASTAELRRQLLNWLLLRHARSLIKDGRLDDAARLTAKVEGLDQRAQLSFEIAAEALRKHHDQGRARQLLAEATAEALKAPETIRRARTLLGAAYLYAKFDRPRALEVMAEVIKTTNRLAEPNLSGTTITQPITGANFGVYAASEVPGFSLENVFREMSAHDFNETLHLAQSLEDGYLRASATLIVASECLKGNFRQEAPVEPRARKGPRKS